MGSPEKPIDVEMGDMSESAKLNPDIETKPEQDSSDEKSEARFTGLKKEELLAISNQPKWVRARWILFIIFWLVWIGMLVGAILIVVNAPRCKPEPSLQWYQDAVVYEADVAEFDKNFEGMEKHLSYIKSLNADTLLVAGAGDPNDPASVVNNEMKQFENLVTAVHDKGMKILVDFVVDSLSTSNVKFVKSASAACSPLCDMFVWASGNPAAETDAQWIRNEDRNSSYKASKSDVNRAFINYGNTAGTQYLDDTLAEWFNRSIDGVQIRNIDYVQGTKGKYLVSGVWNKFFTNQTDSTRALFVYSSDPNTDLNPVTLNANQSNTDHSPVILNALVPKFVNQSNAGKSIQDSLQQWRDQSRSISGFVVSPLDEPLAADRFGSEYTAGASLLSIALPGVPIIRSGDEFAAMSGIFNWTKEKTDPQNENSYLLKQTKELTVRLVAGIQSSPSLRFDSRNGDTVFNFLDTGVSDIVAFVRRWDQKAAVLVVSNMSPVNHEVNVVVKNGLMKDDSLAEEAKVVVSSSSAFKSNEGKVELKNLNMMAGTTVVLSL